MKALSYQLYLLEPTLVTALEGDPNSAVSFDYIPGSVIRGAVIGLFMRQNRVSELDAADDATRRVFFSDSAQYLNAYPLVDGARSLPAPNSWNVQKGEKSPIYDFAWGIERPENPKGVGGFAVVVDASIEKASVKRFIAVHTQRDRQKGRSIEGSGALYRYDSLAAGQIFAGAIVCENDADADWLHEFIADGLEVQIGGARSAGYGRVRFERVALDESAENPSHFEAGQPLVITLLSDAIVHNDDGEYEPNLDTLKLALARRLDIAPDALGTAYQVYLGTTLVGGFNRKWGLPLPQTAALSMSSTIVFTDHSLARDQVDELMRYGFGERRVDGFGRIGINLYTQQQYQLVETDGQTGKKPDKNQSSQTIEHLPQPIARRELMRAIDVELTRVANQIGVSNPPKSSQINALRTVIQSVLRQAVLDLSVLHTVIEHIDERSVARRQFEKARVSGQPLSKWVSDTSGDSNRWSAFIKDARIQGLLQSSAVDANEERQRFNLRLIDAVLARAAKQTQRKEGGDE